jgi:hypothetical protein
MLLQRLAAFALIAAPLAAAPAMAQAPATAATYAHAVPIAGNWTYRAVADGSEAVFADLSAQPQLTVRCTRSTRRVTIAKPASGAAPYLFVWTSSNTRNVPASFRPATAQLVAELTMMDALLDSIAFSRGRFAVSASGTPALVLPAGPEIGRIVEDCRV